MQEEMHLQTLLVLLSVAKAAHAYTYTGCFMSNEANGVLRHRAFKSSKLTHEACRDRCLEKSYAYFGLHGGHKCLCGRQLHSPVRVGDENCAWRCHGNQTQLCGSDQCLMVFKLTSKDPTSQQTSENDTGLKRQVSIAKGAATAIKKPMASSEIGYDTFARTSAEGMSAPSVAPRASCLPVKFMQRFRGDVSFARPWVDYEAGFGRGNGDFWLGLRAINLILDSGAAILRVEMKLWTGKDIFAEYSDFTVGDAGTKYRMNYVAMTARSPEVSVDGLQLSRNNSFSTMDQDNDRNERSCARASGNGGFWYGSCGPAPTGLFPRTSNDTSQGYVRWAAAALIFPKEVRMFLKR